MRMFNRRKNSGLSKKPKFPNSQLVANLKKKEAEKKRNIKLEKVLKPAVKKLTDVNYVFRDFSVKVRKNTTEIYKLAAEFLKLSTDRAVVIGRLMSEIKTELDHGKWEEKIGRLCLPARDPGFKHTGAGFRLARAEGGAWWCVAARTGFKLVLQIPP